jgi:hypothetical protein
MSDNKINETKWSSTSESRYVAAAAGGVQPLPNHADRRRKAFPLGLGSLMSFLSLNFDFLVRRRVVSVLSTIKVASEFASIHVKLEFKMKEKRKNGEWKT